MAIAVVAAGRIVNRQGTVDDAGLLIEMIIVETAYGLNRDAVSAGMTIRAQSVRARNVLFQFGAAGGKLYNALMVENPDGPNAFIPDDVLDCC